MILLCLTHIRCSLRLYIYNSQKFFVAFRRRVIEGPRSFRLYKFATSNLHSTSPILFPLSYYVLLLYTLYICLKDTYIVIYIYTYTRTIFSVSAANLQFDEQRQISPMARRNSSVARE